MSYKQHFYCLQESNLEHDENEDTGDEEKNVPTKEDSEGDDLESLVQSVDEADEGAKSQKTSTVST
jgi:hypothetical protein